MDNELILKQLASFAKNTKTCVCCGREFIPRRSDQIYCSNTCRCKSWQTKHGYRSHFENTIRNKVNEEVTNYKETMNKELDERLARLEEAIFNLASKPQQPDQAPDTATQNVMADIEAETYKGEIEELKGLLSQEKAKNSQLQSKIKGVKTKAKNSKEIALNLRDDYREMFLYICKKNGYTPETLAYDIVNMAINNQSVLSDKLNREEVQSIINKYPECKGNLGKNAKATAEKSFKTMFEENFPDDED